MGNSFAFMGAIKPEGRSKSKKRSFTSTEKSNKNRSERISKMDRPLSKRKRKSTKRDYLQGEPLDFAGSNKSVQPIDHNRSLIYSQSMNRSKLEKSLEHNLMSQGTPVSMFSQSEIKNLKGLEDCLRRSVTEFEKTKSTAAKEEAKVALFLKAIEEVGEMNQPYYGLFSLISNGLQDGFKKYVSNLKIEREKAELDVTDVQESMYQMERKYKNLEKRHLSEKKDMERTIANFESEKEKAIGEVTKKNKKDMKELEMLRKEIKQIRRRNEEVIKRLDLDEIDLVTERLKVFMGETITERSLKKERPVPSLDFSKIYQWREKQNFLEGDVSSKDVHKFLDEEDSQAEFLDSESLE